VNLALLYCPAFRPPGGTILCGETCLVDCPPLPAQVTITLKTGQTITGIADTHERAYRCAGQRSHSGTDWLAHDPGGGHIVDSDPTEPGGLDRFAAYAYV
jgi:hypothetical protein